ncbi:MAG: DUF3048 domain-containing protein [Actinomycetes bacterium]
MRPLPLIVALSLMVSLAACGGEEARTQAGPGRLPLTGEAVDTVPDRGALVVKIDNSASARPQVGLDAADLVVEELVEGGMTRLAVFFHSRLPKVAGPVRSLRNSDIGIVAPTGGVLAASGGARVARRAVDAAGVHTVLPPNPAFYRESGRRAPYNLMLRPAGLGTTLSQADAPADYLPWGTTPSPSPSARTVHTANVRFSGVRAVTWTYGGTGGWSRTPDFAAAGQSFVPDTVLVLRVRTRDAGYRDPAGNAVPETVIDGSGEALLLHAGKAVQGRWRKKGAAGPLTLVDGAGAALRVPPGHTWIELVPERGSVSTR